MTITPSPNQEALIEAAIQAGLIRSAQDALDVGLLQLSRRVPPSAKRAPGRKSLAQLFAESPLKALDIEFSRDPDPGRPVDL